MARKHFTGNDLYHFHRCPHTLTMRFHMPHGPMPSVEPSPEMERLLAWGIDHERRFAEREGYVTMPSIPDAGLAGAHKATIEAMRTGVPRIFQGVLTTDGMTGVVDLLRRVEGRSLLGDYHYEVGDVKSSTRPKAEQAMQVLFYSHLLDTFQGRRPEHGFLILADESEWRFRLDNYWDYFGAVLAESQQVLLGEHTTAPIWIPACHHCRWQLACRPLLEQAGDLSLVPGMTRGRRATFRQNGIMTEAQLAALPDQAVPGLRMAHLVKLRAQALARTEDRVVTLDGPGLQRPVTGLHLSFHTDFARQGAVFAMGARWLDGGEQANRRFFADSPTDMPACLVDIAAFLASHLDRPWMVYDMAARAVVESMLDRLPGLPALSVLQQDLQEAFALPVDAYDLASVAKAVGGSPPPEGTAIAPPLRYHLWLAERDSVQAERLEALQKWELDAMAAIDAWMTSRGCLNR